MAYKCSATTNEDLVAALVKHNLLSTPEVKAAMRRVDRGWFVRQPTLAYDDCPLPIGYGVTISAPHMHAMMLELVAPTVLATRQQRGTQQALRILDIGSGSGYMTAALAALCEAAAPNHRGDRGSRFMWEVVGIDHVEALQKKAAKVIKENFPAWVAENRVLLVTGDGLKPQSVAGAGAGQRESFDIIHVGATAPSYIVPEYLRLLRCNGTLVIPIGDPSTVQTLQVYTKNGDGDVSMQRTCDVQFVPLTSLDLQLSS